MIRTITIHLTRACTYCETFAGGRHLRVKMKSSGYVLARQYPPSDLFTNCRSPSMQADMTRLSHSVPELEPHLRTTLSVLIVCPWEKA
jgi:hypothetical protein